MFKKRKIDFILYEDNYEIIIFRFLPRQSSCHSFESEPPKSWEEVYKVYYSYKIFRRYKDDNSTEVLFSCYCDECSAIDEVAEKIKYIVKGQKQVIRTHLDEDFTIQLLDNPSVPLGYGVTWIISEINEELLYQVTLWNYDDTGYRFFVYKEKLREFGEYLLECCEYMLTHGDPI